MPVDFLATHKLLPVNNKAQDRFVKFYIMYIYISILFNYQVIN